MPFKSLQNRDVLFALLTFVAFFLLTLLMWPSVFAGQN